jgi:hypothetical protein
MGFLPEPAEHAVAQIGTITQKHLQYANDLIASLPRAVIDAAHEPYGARAVIYALLVNAEPEARARQLEILPSSAEPDVWKLMQGLLPVVGGLEAGVRLPLIDLALPALRELSPDQYRRFTHVVSELAKADDRISIFEWTLQRILLTHLRPHFEGVARQRHLYRGFKRLADPCEQVFSALVAASSNADAVADQAFADAAGALQLSGLRLISLDEIDLPGLDAALDALSGLTPPLKSRFLSACAQLITADHEVTLEEAELFRAIADTLGCPVPPLLPGQALIRT